VVVVSGSSLLPLLLLLLLLLSFFRGGGFFRPVRFFRTIFVVVVVVVVDGYFARCLVVFLERRKYFDNHINFFVTKLNPTITCIGGWPRRPYRLVLQSMNGGISWCAGERGFGSAAAVVVDPKKFLFLKEMDSSTKFVQLPKASFWLNLAACASACHFDGEYVVECLLLINRF
jgi:hypothetical protein